MRACSTPRVSLVRKTLTRTTRKRRSVSVSNPTTTADKQTTTAPSPSANGAPLNWFRQWYPVFIVKDLDPKLPHPVVVLGKKLVVWRDVAGEWRCFEDRCPHRLAALSEGRIDEKGNLFCNYHGWSFGPSGKCENIPHLPPDTLPAALVSPRSCATSHPTAVAEGLLFVWADADPDAEEHARTAGRPGVMPELDDPTSGVVQSTRGWYMRDVPNTYISFKENAFNDPGHDTILHHKAGPNFNRARAEPMVCLSTEGPTLGGYSGIWQFSRAQVKAKATATLPTYQRFEVSFDGTRSWLAGAYGTPTTGKYSTRLFFTDATPAKGSPVMAGGWLMKLLGARAWIQHLMFHSVFDADITMQHTVDAQRAAGNASAMYMPAQVDRLVNLFHTWMRLYGGGGPPFEGPQEELPRVPRQQLLDRLHTHTLKCKACSGAYHNTQRLLAAAKVLAAVSFLAACAVAHSTGVSVASAFVAAVAGLCSVATVSLQRLLQQFIFVDYDEHHPSKND